MKNAITAIIVDDEPHARQALQHLLKAHPEITILAECENGKAAVKAVNDLRPQLMFLDIHMPKLDGFEVLELLGDTAPMTIFVTAHDDYAIAAFEKNALDYLLKPVSKSRLQQSINRIAQRLASQTLITSNTFSHSAFIAQEKSLHAPLQRILIRDRGEVHVIATREIIAIESADDYVVIHTKTQSHIKQERLGNLELLLDPQQFCRIHRATIINVDYLKGIETEGKDTRFARLNIDSNKKGQFPISRSGYTKLLKIL